MNTIEIWKEFNQDLFMFIQKRVSNEYDAEDVLQEVFKKIHDSIHHLEDQSKIQSWVYQITRNAITDFYRLNAKKNNAEVSFDVDKDFPEEINEQSNLNHEVSRWLRCIVDGIDSKYKEAILLTEFGNLTQKELAMRLGISISGAKSRVQRGREKVKEMLLACCHIERDRLGNVIDYYNKAEKCQCAGCLL
jgi:RNA polymerase sigma-70 factor, ECF subfamily